MNDSELKEGILRALARVAPEAEGVVVDPNEPFRNQFEIDSMDFLNFILGLEKDYGIKVPETSYPRFGNLSGAIASLGPLVAAKA